MTDVTLAKFQGSSLSFFDDKIWRVWLFEKFYMVLLYFDYLKSLFCYQITPETSHARACTATNQCRLLLGMKMFAQVFCFGH